MNRHTCTAPGTCTCVWDWTASPTDGHGWTRAHACVHRYGGRAGQGRAGQGGAGEGRAAEERRVPGGQGHTHSPENKLDIFWRGKVPGVCCGRSTVLRAMAKGGRGLESLELSVSHAGSWVGQGLGVCMNCRRRLETDRQTLTRPPGRSSMPDLASIDWQTAAEAETTGAQHPHP